MARSQGLLFAADPFERSLFQPPPEVLPLAAQLPLADQPPALLQHADGRFFALNVNLRPGQFFQTPDGRVFTLAAAPVTAAADKLTSTAEAADATAATAIASADSDAAILDIRGQGPSDTAEDTDVAAEGDDEPASILARDVTTAVPAAATTPAPRRTAQPQVIAAAPLTPSNARFIASATPFAFAPPGQFFGAAPPAVFSGHPVLAAGGQLLGRLPAQVGQSGQRHLLADSNTSVFRGFFSYPAAGIDFDF